MKKQLFVVVALVGMYSTGFSQNKPTVKDPAEVVVQGANSGRLNVIDPSITDISFVLIKQNTGDKIRVTVTLKNVGLKHYQSNANQQNVQLWEEYSSANRKIVKVFPFQNLNGGASLTFVYERPALKASDEFPPNYTATIVYDPDIRMDNNVNNDDANLGNNSQTKNPRQ
ncbi:MAG: hypothetical protein U0Y10_02420 [Spirosomataceae bacterium]